MPNQKKLSTKVTTQKTSCLCLYEIENKLPRTKMCFMPCAAQVEILNKRALSVLKKLENQFSSIQID